MSVDHSSQTVVIVGPMGAGKTTLGRGLAAVLGRDFIDSDESVVRGTGRTSRELADSEGVDWLHRLEREALLEALDRREPVVIAAAASVIESPEVTQAMAAAFCVFLTAPAEVLARRAAGGSHRRQVGESEDLERRTPLFEAAANLLIDTESVSVEDAVELVVLAM